MMSQEELIRLAQSGDKNATECLITENAGLIWSVARRYLGRGTEADDLYQLGCLGFLKAVEGFDLNFGTQFSTYAVPKIAGEMGKATTDIHFFVAIAVNCTIDRSQRISQPSRQCITITQSFFVTTTTTERYL